MKPTPPDPLPGTQYLDLYPESGGRRSADTMFHSEAREHLFWALRDCFEDQDDMYSATGLMIYYKEGDPKCYHDPDAMVARGVRGKHMRLSFRVWEEGVMPCVFFEITSCYTWRKDLYKRPSLYAATGVKEYFLYDPEGCYISPVLQGWRAVKRKPVPIKPGADGSLVSKQLGVRMAPEDCMLRLTVLKTGEVLLSLKEKIERERQRADQYRQSAEQARRSAEEARRSAEEARRNADDAKRLAEEARRRADAAKAQSRQALAELEQLKKGD